MKLESMEFLKLQELADIASYRARHEFGGNFKEAIDSVISENTYATASALGTTLNCRRNSIRQSDADEYYKAKALQCAIEHVRDMLEGLRSTGNDAADGIDTRDYT